MEQLTIPTQIELLKDKDPRKATLTVFPCNPGYGTTIGNALRRVLLSSLPGAAVTGVKITGAEHEFSALEHVKEDVVQILLNLKQLRLKIFTDQPVRLLLNAKGEREVSAADITRSSDVEIVNPELHIAELTDPSAELAMEIVAGVGRGYVPVEERADEAREICHILIDAVYTPIRAVGYSIENVRVGQKTNYDKLTLNIETDGSIDPAEAIRQATKILMDHFGLLADIEMVTAKKAAK